MLYVADAMTAGWMLTPKNPKRSRTYEPSIHKGVEIAYYTEMKYLGIILYSRNRAEWSRMALATLYTCKTTIVNIWCLKPKILYRIRNGNYNNSILRWSPALQ